MPTSSEQNLATVARRLGYLRDEVVFVGGAIVGLLLDDPAATPARPTDDVDVIIEAASKARYDAVAQQLLRLGFQPDTSEGAPLCRWLIDDVPVDVMPTSAEALGFTNTWYSDAITQAIVRELAPGLTIRIATPAYFLAMKLEAFASRGNGDYIASADVEDVISVIDGYGDIANEIARTNERLRNYISKAVRSWLDDSEFVATLPGHLTGDAASQARLPIVLDRLRQIAGQ